MKTLLNGTSRFSFWNMIARAPEGEGGAAPAPAAATSDAAAPASTASVLFPDDKPADPAGDGAAPKEGEGDAKPDDAAADWKEYEADAAKTDEENAAAKAEHDKGKPAEKTDAEKAAATIPEDGKYALAMPEGVEVDQELLDALGPKFAAKKMTNGEAQELADEFVKIQTARAAKQNETWATTIAGWVDGAKADKEIGGAKWDATVATSRRAVDTLGTPELREYLNASGGGNHPELIRFMAKVGSMIAEDKPAENGGGGSSRPAETAHVLFPNDAPKR